MPRPSEYSDQPQVYGKRHHASLLNSNLFWIGVGFVLGAVMCSLMLAYFIFSTQVPQ